MEIKTKDAAAYAKELMNYLTEVKQNHDDQAQDLTAEDFSGSYDCGVSAGLVWLIDELKAQLKNYRDSKKS